MKLAFAVILLAASTCLGTPVIDPELQKLHEAMDQPLDQAGLNEASGNIGRYWDRKVRELDEKIISVLDDEGAELFEASRKQWQAHRKAHANFVADTYRGGTIQPLIFNIAFAEITETRAKELEKYLRENFK